jgi:RNA polymerase sigma-70 factor (TIGR02957 family)
MSGGGSASGLDAYAEFRPLMFSIAYRMLGTVSDAEDIVQEVFLRVHRGLQDGECVESPRAYVTTLTTRLAIDQLRSARTRREIYFGPWLPEPVLTSDQDPSHLAEMADSLSISFLVLLEQLSPVERAVFLLREVFGHGYEEIAEIVGKSEGNCRQIFARARKNIDANKPRFAVDRDQQRDLAAKFFAAVDAGEFSELVDFLAADVVFQGDGGGKGRGLPRPVYGRDRVNRLLRDGFFPRYRQIGARIEPTEINGEPGALCLDAQGRLINVLCLDISDGAVNTVRSVINPDKLAHLGYELSDLGRPGGESPSPPPGDGESRPPETEN